MASPRSYASTAKRVTNNSILYSKCSLGTDLFLKHLARTPILKYRQARFGPKLGRCSPRPPRARGREASERWFLGQFFALIPILRSEIGQTNRIRPQSAKIGIHCHSGLRRPPRSAV